MRNYEGELNIYGDEFWEWVRENYLPDSEDEVVFSIPTWNEEEQCLRIKYAGSNETHPSSWNKKPDWMSKT